MASKLHFVVHFRIIPDELALKPSPLWYTLGETAGEETNHLIELYKCSRFSAKLKKAYVSLVRFP